MNKKPVLVIDKESIAKVVAGHRNKQECSPDTHCAICMVPLVPEHAHMRCPKCGLRDSCCF